MGGQIHKPHEWSQVSLIYNRLLSRLCEKKGLGSPLGLVVHLTSEKWVVTRSVTLSATPKLGDTMILS